MQTVPSQFREAGPRPVLGGDLVFTEHAVGVLRRHLRDAGLGEWRIFHGPMAYLFGIDNLLDRLDPAAVWEAPDLALTGEETVTAITFEDEPTPLVRAWPGGVLHLRQLRVIVARWYWHDTANRHTAALYLLASPEVECIEALRQQLRTLNRATDEPVWQTAGEYGPDSQTPRGKPDAHGLLLTPAVRGRVETEILGFFAPAVQRMYDRLNVPYRRGVLLYGDPGNGKTSLIRYVGASLPDVSCTLLRAGSDFGTDTLTEAISEWKRQAPAILVIEDLTAVIEKVNLSTLLNVLDGIDRKSRPGLMLIASTNHPDRLDPALSNRPGRFDVVIELPPPDEAQRLDYFRSRLIEIDLPTIEAVVVDTPRMSFAHLEEVVRLSGMIAIRDDREFRVAADVTAAVEHVRTAFNRAQVGYAKLPEAPFGLAAFARRERSRYMRQALAPLSRYGRERVGVRAGDSGFHRSERRPTLDTAQSKPSP